MARQDDVTHHTGRVSTNVTYGDGVPGDDDLHLLGDVSGGRRVIELGITRNAVPLARAGGKAIAVDPDPARIADLRAEAAAAGLSVECHAGELADLGFAPSGTIDAVVANHTLDTDDDLGRTLRQVHRILKPSGPLIVSLAHPFAAVGVGSDAPLRPYGSTGRTVGDLLAALDRTNFRIEAFHELGVTEASPVPTTLVLKATKQGS